MVTDGERSLASEKIGRIFVGYPTASDTGDLVGGGQLMDRVAHRFTDVPRKVPRSPGGAGWRARPGTELSTIPTTHLGPRKPNINMDVDRTDALHWGGIRSYGMPQVVCTGGYGHTFRREEKVWNQPARGEWTNLRMFSRVHLGSSERITIG